MSGRNAAAVTGTTVAVNGEQSCGSVARDLPPVSLEMADVGTPTDRAALPYNWVQRSLEIGVGLISWLLITSPLWASVLFPTYWSWAFLIFSVYWFSKSARVSIHGLNGFRVMKVWEASDWLGLGRFYARWHRLHQLVVFPTYREPLEVLDSSLRYLLAQDFPLHRITVVIAFEARDAGAAAKAAVLRERYGATFENFWTTFHPEAEGEVRGKSSNLSYAVPWAKRRLVDEMGVSIDDTIVTVCDADSRLHPKYLSALSYTYLTADRGEVSLYQPALLFHANLQRLPGPMRVLNAFYSVLSLARLCHKNTLVTQSTYSLGLAACQAVNYWDVDIIPEDSHIFFKVFFKLGPGVIVEPIFLPVWADAAEGRGWWSTLSAHYKQARRWAWGVLDASYVIWYGLRAKQIPFWLRFIRVGHYIKEHLLWPAQWFILFCGLKLLPTTDPLYASGLEVAKLNSWLSVIFTSSFISMALVIWLDRQIRTRYSPHSAPPESWPRLAHWLLMPAALLVASVLPAVDAHLRMLLDQRLEYQVTEKFALTLD